MFSIHELCTSDTGPTIFHLTVPANTKKEDLTNSEKYRDIVRSHQDGSRKYFNFGDRLEILASDGSFVAKLLIVGSSRDELFTRLVEYKDFKKVIKKEDEMADFDITYDEKTKFTITRKSDKKLIKQGFTSEEEALYHLKNIY